MIDDTDHPPLVRHCAQPRVFAFSFSGCAMYDCDLIGLWIPVYSIVREVRIGEVDRDPSRLVNLTLYCTPRGAVRPQPHGAIPPLLRAMSQIRQVRHTPTCAASVPPAPPSKRAYCREE
jgi:hypothetical protein